MSPQPGKEYTNNDVAQLFDRIAALLEIKGEVIYKIRAYQRAAESLRALGEDVNKLNAEGRLNEIPAVGKAISEKIQEFLANGRLKFLEELEQEVPPGLLDLLEVPDLGPKKAALFWKELGITDLPGLEAAAKAGKLKSLPGMGEKSQSRILAGIEALARRSDRMTLSTAWEYTDRWLDWLRAQPGVLHAEPAGSLRRWRETIGDLDLVAACTEGSPALELFVQQPEVERVLSVGENKASVEVKGGLRIQLWVTSPQRFGSLWLYATGSKNHNVRLRELAQKMNLSLSDRGIETADGKLLTFPDEESVYRALDTEWIPPELREDRGEVEAALKRGLPRLVEMADLHAELHAHTTWSDGVWSGEALARTALQHGYQVQAITDHSAYMGITRGVKAEDLLKQRVEIEHIQAQLGHSIMLLHGIEVDITAEGHLALPDDILASLDMVIASLHVSLRHPRDVVTHRLLNAIRNPHVDAIAHPSGRLLPNREGADLDWDAVLQAAQENGIALEINANPMRLDLNDVYTRRAIEMGIPIMINTDAHSAVDLDTLRFGVGTARRAWVTAENVINAWTPERIKEWLTSRNHRAKSMPPNS
jgi:DNA polymerase (family 10)